MKLVSRLQHFAKSMTYLLLQEVNKVRLDTIVVGARGVTDGRQQDRGLGVSLGDGLRVQSGQGVVPKVEKSSHFGIGNGRSAHFDTGRSVEGASQGRETIDKSGAGGILGSKVLDGNVALKVTWQEGKWNVVRLLSFCSHILFA